VCREGVFVFAVELGGVDKVVLVGSCYLWCGGAGGAEIRVVCTVSAIMPRHMTVGDAQGGGLRLRMRGRMGWCHDGLMA